MGFAPFSQRAEHKACTGQASPGSDAERRLDLSPGSL